MKNLSRGVDQALREVRPRVGQPRTKAPREEGATKYDLCAAAR